MTEERKGDELQSQSDKPENEVLRRIAEKYHHLGKRTKLVADYVLKNPRSIVSLSITELADCCKVSQFTVTNLSKQISLSGYQEMKLIIAKDFIRPLEHIHEGISEQDDISDVALKLAESHVLSINATREVLDMYQLNMAIDALEKAKRVDFYGVGNTSCVALNAYHKFFRLGFYTQCIEDAHAQVMSASLMAPGDVAVGISSSGSSKVILDALKEAKEAGATTICITGKHNTPLTKVADIKIITSTPESFYRSESIENLLAQIYIVDVLYVSLAMRRQDEFLKTLDKTRKALLVKRV